MKGKTVLKVILWIMVIFSAVLIFSFSAENADSSNETSRDFLRALLGLFPGFRGMRSMAQEEFINSIMTVVRKCAHFSIYAFFGFWLMHLIRQYRPKYSLIFTVAVSMAYAFSDELHQRFVAGRSGRLLDVFIDTSGALTGALVALAFALIWQKLRKLIFRHM